MAFPQVVNGNTTNGSTASATPIVNLPANIAPGNLLLLFFRTAGTGTVTWPSDWAQLFDTTADASDDEFVGLYKTADGSEGATVTLGSGNFKFAAIAVQISGAMPFLEQAPQRNAAVTGTDAAPDPGTLSPTGGAKDYLWLWVGSWEGEQTSPPAGNPTNYTNPTGASSGAGGAIATNCRVAIARRELNAASEDPPSWTISVADDWTVFTVAIHPAPPPEVVMAPPRAA